ncbi:MAG: DEAD/DEAH box helicase, partial [Bifidobacteriaceae bacterium]|nr:DEAD/DEAH box helicase [Bifidobacteriaceae bacterium]
MNQLLAALRDPDERARCITHLARTQRRAGQRAAWPEWTPDWIEQGYERLGIEQPWAHQVAAMNAARAGHTVIATSTGSGKSLALWTPVLTALDAPYHLGRIKERRTRPAALYLAPTKALAADQLAGLEALFRAADVTGLTAATCDGDTPPESRRYLQSHADIIATNPDFLHFSFLETHPRWAGLLRGLSYVIVDELHAYRGVLGAHVAWVMRRLRRIAAHYGADPIFLAASATVSDPDATAACLIGVERAAVTAITADTAERGENTFVFWRPAPYDPQPSTPKPDAAVPPPLDAVASPAPESRGVGGADPSAAAAASVPGPAADPWAAPVAGWAGVVGVGASAEAAAAASVPGPAAAAPQGALGADGVDAAQGARGGRVSAQRRAGRKGPGVAAGAGQGAGGTASG